jgi:hypothetical protein
MNRGTIARKPFELCVFRIDVLNTMAKDGINRVAIG